MGMYYSTYFAFGTQIAKNAYDSELMRRFDDPEDIDREVEHLDVGILMAGDYDRDRLFLVTYTKRVEYGEVARVDPFSLGHQESDWKHNLQLAADHLGVEITEEPAWFVVADVS